jgi:hypothetical protein
LQILKSAGSYTINPNIKKPLSLLEQDLVDQDLVGWFEFRNYVIVDYTEILTLVNSKSWYQSLVTAGFDVNTALAGLVDQLNQTFFTGSEVFNGLETSDEDASSQTIVDSISITGATYTKGSLVSNDLVVSLGRIPVTYFASMIDQEVDNLNISSIYLRQLVKTMATEIVDLFLITISSMKFKADIYDFRVTYNTTQTFNVGIVGGGGGGGGGSHNRAATSGSNSINLVPSTQGQQGQDMPGDGGGGGGGGGGIQGGAGGAYGPDNAHGGRGGYTGAGGQSGNGINPVSTNIEQWRSPAGQGGNGAGASGKAGLAVLVFEPLGLGKVKDNDAWRDIEAIWVKDNDEWKPVTGVWVKNQGTWKEIGGAAALSLTTTTENQYFG